MAVGKGKGMKLTKGVAKEKKGAVRAEKGKEKKGKDFSSDDGRGRRRGRGRKWKVKRRTGVTGPLKQ